MNGPGDRPRRRVGTTVEQARTRWVKRASPLSTGELAPAVRRSALALLSTAALVLTVYLANTSLAAALAVLVVLLIIFLVLVWGASRVGIGLLVLGYGTVAFSDLHLFGPLAQLDPADPFFIAGFILLAPRLLTSPLRLPGIFVIGALGLIGTGALSLLVNEQPSANTGYLVTVIRGVVFLPLLVAWWQPARREMIAVASAYMFGNSVNTIASLINGPEFANRHAGLTWHPNVMAYGQVLSIALVPFLISTVPRRFHWMIGLMAAASAYGIWISGSRGALVCAAALIVLYPLFTRSVRAGLGVAFLCVPVIVMINRVWDNPDSSALGRLLGDRSGQASTDERIEGAEAGIDQILANPWLGDGWLTVWAAHNAYLQIPAAIGVFGLAFYLLLLSSLLRPLARISTNHKLLAVPALAAVLLDLVLPILGAKFVWAVIALALCAGPMARRDAAADEQNADAAERTTVR